MIGGKGIRQALCVAVASVGLVVVPTPPSATAATPAYRVLITGDSITQGSSGDYTWRYRLWNKLASTAPSNVAFVGTRTDLYDNVTNAFGSQHYAATFTAKSHAAQWGGSFKEEIGRISSQVTSSTPNVLVTMLGSNDLAYLTSPAATITNLRTYISRARAAKPGIDIVIAEVINRFDPWSQTYTLTTEANDYATRIRSLATELNTSSQRVVVAPTRTGWNAKIHTWDGTHPNPTGEALIAQRVSQGLAAVGVGATSPDISGTKTWAMPGPAVSLTPGSEEMALVWNRSRSGATGMFIETRLTNVNEAWRRLPYAVSGDGWTAGLLAAGGTYQFRVVPSKGWNTGTAGPGSTATASGPTPGAATPVNFIAGAKSSLGGVSASASWGSGSNASGYYLSHRVMHNGTMVWSNLPYPIQGRSWKLEPLPQGRRMQVRVQTVRGFLKSDWSYGSITRMKGLAGNRVYAALGDSYSSGLGSNRGIYDEPCMKATHAWATLMQSPFQFKTRLLACQGKTTSHVSSNQIPAMKTFFSEASSVGKPQVVTLTVGGNDVGFSDELKVCIRRDCAGDEATMTTKIDDKSEVLKDIYREIKTAAPYADIVVGGYPWVVEPTGTSGNIVCRSLDRDERDMVARLSTRLNNTIAAAANDTGVWTVGNGVRSQFVGHNACTEPELTTEWIHAGDLDIGGVEGFVDMKSFHPKDAGQLAYAIAFSNVLVARAQ